MFIYKTLSRVELSDVLRHRIRRLDTLYLLSIEDTVAVSQPRLRSLFVMTCPVTVSAGNIRYRVRIRHIFNNNKLISLAHYIQQTIHYGMRYSIDLPVGVLKSVADSYSFVSGPGWTRWSRGNRISVQCQVRLVSIRPYR